MTDIERAARALWNVWRQSKAAPDWAADVTWEQLSQWAATGNGAAEIARDTVIAESGAVIESVLLEPSEEAVEAANGYIRRVSWSDVRSHEEQLSHVRAALRVAALAILGRDGSAG